MTAKTSSKYGGGEGGRKLIHVSFTLFTEGECIYAQHVELALQKTGKEYPLNSLRSTTHRAGTLLDDFMPGRVY